MYRSGPAPPYVLSGRRSAALLDPRGATNLAVVNPLDDTAIPIRFRLNGTPTSVTVAPADRLLDVLRYRLGLTGTKEGCGEGECGACSVRLDGLPANACLIPGWQVDGADVRTVEAVPDSIVRPLLETGATQCGACTPGVVITAEWIHDRPTLLETHTLRELMAGNLCRCTGYDGIIDGVRRLVAER